MLPRVAMNGGIPILVTSSPLMTPTASPKSSAAPTATPTPKRLQLHRQGRRHRQHGTDRDVDAAADQHHGLAQGDDPVEGDLASDVGNVLFAEKDARLEHREDGEQHEENAEDGPTRQESEQRSIRVPRYRRLTRLSSPTTARKTAPFTMN